MKNKVTGLITILLIVCSTMLLTKCQKEYSYEGGAAVPETALYTLSGSGGACLNAVINGTYESGIALGTGNTIVVEVDVDSIGGYFISTNLVNGIVFSAKGNFTTTGPQTVTLLGNGTPTNAGAFAFQVNGATGCAISITFIAASGNNYTLTGDPATCSGFVLNGSYMGGKALTTSNTVQVQVDVKKTGPYNISTDTLDGIYFSASGNFTSTGIKTVTLAGKGTPEFPRNLSFTTKGLNTSCKFDLTVQNADPVATYVIESGGGGTSMCVATLNGTYTAGTPLSSANTLKIRVFVTVVGNFTISTQTLDGIMFSYTGTFSALGSQDVTLQGTGTPTNSGTFTFTPTIVGPAPLGGAGCAYNLTVL